MSSRLNILMRFAAVALLLSTACEKKSSASPSAPSDSTSSSSSPSSPPTPTPTPTPAASTALLTGSLGGRQVFPPDNWWNQDISRAPVDGQSASYIAFIGASKTLHPDFGGPPWGIPYVTVGAAQPRVVIGWFKYASESDAGASGDAPAYPIPEEAKSTPNYIENGVAGGGDSGDRHLILIDRDRWLLYETFATKWNPSSGKWEAGSGAVFDLSSNARRPEGWTSADAAGLAIFPGLVRYEEVYSGSEIRHAFRMTVRSTNGYVWPASHRAGTTSGALPLGARLRLKASVDISGYSPALQRIFRAMKTYGLIVADNGADMYVTGTMDGRWNNDELNPAFGRMRASDFEVIQLGWR